MPPLNPVLFPAFSAASDFVSSRLSFNSALDGTPSHWRAAPPSIHGPHDGFAGGGVTDAEKPNLPRVKSLAVLSRERDVDLPVKKWERERHAINALQLAALAAGVALGSVGFIDVMVFGSLLTLPLRYGTLFFTVSPYRALNRLDQELSQIRHEFCALLNDLMNAMTASASGEVSRMKRKKDARTLRDTQDRMRKKWREMDQPLKDMRRILGNLTFTKNYLNGWIPRLFEAVPMAMTRWVMSRNAPPGWEDAVMLERVVDRCRKKYEGHLHAWKTVAVVLELSGVPIKDESPSRRSSFRK